MASFLAPPIHIALALGSNLGNRRGVLRAAIEALAPYATITAVSPVYETAAAYVTDQPAFLNMAVAAETKLAAPILLKALKHLEYELGRQPTFHYGPRLIDLDIIFYGDHIITSTELTVPHPRLVEREFVLRPLADIIPSWRHPQNGLTVAEMLCRVPSSMPVCLGPL